MQRFAHIVLTFSLVILSLPVSAQRTMSGQYAPAFSLQHNGLSLCAEAFLSRYTLAGYWEAGIGIKDYDVVLSSGDNLDYIDIATSFGYLHRLVGTRNRLLNVYLGGDIFIGVEWLDYLHNLPSHIQTGLSSIGFLYGLAPKFCMEVFPAKRFALTFNFGLPINFSSKITAFHYEGGIGFKFML